MTFDVVTDWLNWLEWSSVGGYDQYYFVSIFQKFFLTVAAVGTGLWILDFFVLIKKFISFSHEENKLINRRRFHECLPKPEIPDDLDCPPDPEVKIYNKQEFGKDAGHVSELKIGNCSEVGISGDHTPKTEFSNYNDSMSLFEVETNHKSLSELEALNYSEMEIRKSKELEVVNYPPSENSEEKEEDNGDTKKCNNYLSEDESVNYTQQKVQNCKGSPSELKYMKSPCEAEDRDYNNSSSKQKVTNHNETKSESEVGNTKVCGQSEDVQKDKYNSSTTINRLGILARILVGLCEDFPVVLAVFYPTVMPMCGIPAKQKIRSGVTVATIISSMLNSLWTMFCLFCELWGCAKKEFCCFAIQKDSDVEDSDKNSCEQNNRQTTTKRCLKKSSKTCMRQRFITVGKIMLSILIFIIFSTTFSLGFLTISHVLGFISLNSIFTMFPTPTDPFNLRPYAFSSHYGPGLDAEADEAMFIYLHYKLPDWHYISLNNNTKSATFRHIINRLYIGQFHELSHLKDGTLKKAVPCTRAMPFLQNVYQQMVSADCKMIFTLKYFPTYNNWQPFANFIHDFHHYLTIEYGIHINNRENCPAWFYPSPSSSFLSEKVKREIFAYTCNSACGLNVGICQKQITSWKIYDSQGIDSTNKSAELWLLSLAIHGLKTPDTCKFNVRFKHSNKFWDNSWEKVEPVDVPGKFERIYPQFITVPITFICAESVSLRTNTNSCHKLWQENTFLEFESRTCGSELVTGKAPHREVNMT